MSHYKNSAIASIILLTLAACNTIDGVGEDVRATGDAISDTAASAQSELN